MTGDAALFSMVFRALIVLFSSGYNIKICKIIEATSLTLYFFVLRDVSQVRGYDLRGPMVNTLVSVAFALGSNLWPKNTVGHIVLVASSKRLSK